MADIETSIGINLDTSNALAAIKNLQREISAFHTTLARGSSTAAAASASLQKDLINNLNATGKFSASMTNIKSTTESFTAALEKNKFSMGEYFRYAGGASKTFGQKFTKELVQKLIKNQIISNAQIQSKYNFLDKIFIKVLLEEKGNMHKIFFRLFKKNNAKDIVNFLSNNSSFIQDIKVILSMPKLIFFKKLLNF